MDKRLITSSKFLSLVLRHDPARIGLELDANGWANVAELLQKANAAGQYLDENTLREVVATNEKKRFALSEDGARIRANQGHSVKIDLGLEAQVPPNILFHGTATRFLEGIRAEGLVPRERQHVHLSADEPTAIAIGQRHGKPVVIIVEAARMHAEGHEFFVSENGVWLTESVAAAYLVFPNA